jgi:hypothetical protein
MGHAGFKLYSPTRDRPKPPMNIAALPAALLFLLNQSLFPAPSRRPTSRVALAPGGVRLVTWTIPAVIN